MFNLIQAIYKNKTWKCMALSWDILTSNGSEVLQTGAKRWFVCWCVCMRGHSASKILHFHLFFSSIHQFFVWCRNNYDKTENPKNKHWTFKITKVRTEGNSFFFQHNTFQETTGSDLHHITSWFFHFTLSFFLSSSGTTAPCTPSVFAWHLVHLKPLLIKQCLFDFNRLGVKGKLHNSKICEFEIAFF